MASSSLYINILGMCAVLFLHDGSVYSEGLLPEKSVSPLKGKWNNWKDPKIPEKEYEEEPSKPNITAEATFDPQYVTLSIKDYQNATVTLLIRGELKECINITFNYDPPNPSIEPLDNITHLCPDEINGNDVQYQMDSDVVQKEDEHRRRDNEYSRMSFPSLESQQQANKHIVMIVPKEMVHNTFLRTNWDGSSRILLEDEPHHMEPDHLLLNQSINLISRWVGKTIVTIQADPPVVDEFAAFVSVSVIRNPTIDVVGGIFGWIYSIVWDISFLPQVWLNWSRKSVVGFSLDNVTLNVLAYLFYALFNVAFFAVPFVKQQFHERYPRQVNHVQVNDVFFATYGLAIELILAIQCCVYERAKGQRVSYPCRFIVLVSLLLVTTSCILAATQVVWWLDVFYLMSYMKLAITPLKYIPQLYVNYQLKSTKGFSMVGLLLDFTGGVMSLAQMFMLAANNNDWLSIFTDFSKFGLGVITIIFDILFFIQYFHYHCRGNRDGPVQLT